jgi:hypothetical protein
MMKVFALAGAAFGLLRPHMIALAVSTASGAFVRRDHDALASLTSGELPKVAEAAHRQLA